MRWRAATGEIRSADLYDGCVDRPPRAPAGLGRARLRRRGLGAGAGPRRRRRRGSSRALAPPGAGHRGPAGQPDGSRTRPDACSTAARTSRATSGCACAGARATVVTVRHAEVLEPDGSLHLRALRSAKATDTLRPRRRRRRRCSSRRSRSTASATRRSRRTPSSSTRELVAISSDTPPRATFECSRRARSTGSTRTSSGPSATTSSRCPPTARSATSGWAGPATPRRSRRRARTLFDAEAFWRSWLRDLALEQDAVLGVPSVVPNVVLDGPLRFGPRRLGRRRDDRAVGGVRVVRRSRVLADQCDEHARAGSTRSSRAAATMGCWSRRRSSATGWTRTRRLDRPWEAKADSELLANAFFAHSARLRPTRPGSSGTTRLGGAIRGARRRRRRR